jgi:SAM-dependent methyltransferase
MSGWTRQNFRHVAQILRFGNHPAAVVYDSLGPQPWASAVPGWLNLGLWDGSGDEAEAPSAVRRLVATLASRLPAEGVILDVGCGLGVQEEVIAGITRSRRLVALNITLSQLTAGRGALAGAGATPVCADACRLPLRSQAVDGLISVEAAFHFSSRAAFFAEAARVLRPGGVLAMSDVSAERLPRTPAEALAGGWNLRFWGVRRRSLAAAAEIAALARRAGFNSVQVERCGDRVIRPAVRLLRRRVATAADAPRGQRLVARSMLAAWDLLYRRGVIDYLLVVARAG